MQDENYLCELAAHRKGRGQAECTIKAGYTDNGDVILRTIDADGIAPIVALLDKRTARELAIALLQAAEETE